MQFEVDWPKFQSLDKKNKLDFAISLFEGLQLQSAKQAFEYILKQNKKHLEALNYLTDILEQLNQQEEMEELLKEYLIPENEAILTAFPDSYKLFFKYAQTLHGEQSIHYYEIGIKHLGAQIIQGQATKDQMRDIADAHAAIAEIYQTDLLQHQQSEQGCIKNIDLAFQYDPNNLDAQLQLANYHLNKEDEVKAKNDLRFLCQKLLHDNDEYEENFTLQVSKLLVEVEMYHEAEQLLYKTLEKNEQNPETQYMMAFSKMKLQKYSEALLLAQQILNHPKIEEDEELYQGTKELIVELEKQESSTQMEDEEWMDME